MTWSEIWSISNADSFIHLFITRCQYLIPKIYNILFDIVTIREIVTFYDGTSQEMSSKKDTKHHLIITKFGTVLGFFLTQISSDVWTAQAGEILILIFCKKKFKLESVCPVLIWPVIPVVSCSVLSWINLTCPICWPDLAYPVLTWSHCDIDIDCNMSRSKVNGTANLVLIQQS